MSAEIIPVDLHMSTGDRLRLIADLIEAHPEKWDQGSFDSGGIFNDGTYDEQIASEGLTIVEWMAGGGFERCGTGCCVGGWAVLTTPTDEVHGNSFEMVGMASLGIDAKLAHALFYAWDTLLGLPEEDPTAFAAGLRTIASLPEPRSLHDAINALPAPVEEGGA